MKTRESFPNGEGRERYPPSLSPCPSSSTRHGRAKKLSSDILEIRIRKCHSGMSKGVLI